VLVAVNPFGPVQTVFKVIGTSTTELNSMCTMQVRVTEDPMGRTGLQVPLVRVTSDGDGTACDRDLTDSALTILLLIRF
jgi:hypothetical protein